MKIRYITKYRLKKLISDSFSNLTMYQNNATSLTQTLYLQIIMLLIMSGAYAFMGKSQYLKIIFGMRDADLGTK